MQISRRFRNPIRLFTTQLAQSPRVDKKATTKTSTSIWTEVKTNRITMPCSQFAGIKEPAIKPQADLRCMISMTYEIGASRVISQ
jgi:hypothetical protein